MTDHPIELTTIPIQVLGWPFRTEIHLIDRSRLVQLAHFPLDGAFRGGCFDPLLPASERASDALRRLELMQPELHQQFQIEQPGVIQLTEDTSYIEFFDELIAPFGLEREQLDLPSIAEDPFWLLNLGHESLFDLLCGWVDRFETRPPVFQGGALATAGSGKPAEHWAVLSRPDKATYYHWQLHGTERKAAGASEEEAYRLFLEDVEKSLPAFNFGWLLRWLYYHATEFADRPLSDDARPRAIVEAVNFGSAESP